MTIALPLLIALLGLLLYGFAGNSKVQEVGRISYAIGLLVTLLLAGPQVVALFK